MRGSISSQCHYWLRTLQPRSSCRNAAITTSHQEFFHLELSRGYFSTPVQQLQRITPLWRLAPTRDLNIFSIFSKEARAKEKVRLQDELNRGYFADFREMKRTGGRIALASTSLTSVAGSARFPALEVCVPKGGSALTLPAEGFNATLVCMAFRASVQPMVLPWSSSFAQKFNGSTSCSVFEVSVNESAILSLSPIKWLLLRTMRRSQISILNELERKVVHAFGDTYEFREVLEIPNLLSGYAFLVDWKGRVRWRASGMATKKELESMVTCTTRLLQEETSKAI